MNDKKIYKKIRVLKINNLDRLKKIENAHRREFDAEFISYALSTSFEEIALKIKPDKYGEWKTNLYYAITEHSPSQGIYKICKKAVDYLESKYNNDEIDILSISSRIEDDKLYLMTLVRDYIPNDDFRRFVGFFDFIGEKPIQKQVTIQSRPGKLIIPDEIKNFKYTQEQTEIHNEKVNRQNQAYLNASKEKPFLNAIDEYEPTNLAKPEDSIDLVYDLKSNEKELNLITPYEQFKAIYEEILIRLSNGTDKYQYFSVLKGDMNKDSFMAYIESIVDNEYIRTGRLKREDKAILLDKLNTALFKLYIIQPMIDDPNVTDIKITGPDSIRCRVKGKAYISNITFIDDADLKRFIESLAVRNNISLNVPAQTFTDNGDKDYVLRFSFTSEYVNSVDYSYIHIRKVSRKKLLGKDLIKAGMMDKKVQDYLLDCAKHSRGVVFAGPPGSGKTVALNWFLEEGYEQSAEILVIQENDELFAYRKGVMFEHVVNYAEDDKEPVTLEDLGRLALVAGANVFIIGEAKGPEICSAITLSNSGCRTAITIHSPSSTETIDKMADLAQRGYASDYDQAKRMLKSFQTIVYMKDFAVQEISEITGYNEKTKDMEYRYIYRKEDK
ncbi:ATPase, T2SS/T4P/T4SS family [Lachnospira multipara]|uniref:Pilus assembly protein, ATPase of CpaF family n=1 Tax=Lachnospira multipara TaxID=28051 RepID=A0A1H5VPS2_9FIRM|nr:ATPase, T2SS/T4P/T4SS family [Lachnospira multipara]SEF88938.1 Pilus assembly protein, ATPase of CpaF family [Lachnospira multipara]